MSVEGEPVPQQTSSVGDPEDDSNFEMNGPYESFKILYRDPQYEFEIMLFLAQENILDDMRRRGVCTDGIKKVSLLVL
jgi:hypothetical protein